MNLAGLCDALKNVLTIKLIHRRGDDQDMTPPAPGQGGNAQFGKAAVVKIKPRMLIRPDRAAMGGKRKSPLHQIGNARVFGHGLVEDHGIG